MDNFFDKSSFENVEKQKDIVFSSDNFDKYSDGGVILKKLENNEFKELKKDLYNINLKLNKEVSELGRMYSDMNESESSIIKQKIEIAKIENEINKKEEEIKNKRNKMFENQIRNN